MSAVLLCIISCSKEEVTERVIEVPEGKVLVETEIVVDGVVQSKTRASSEAGYTTGDGLYDKTDRVTVAAVANDGYELTSFYDKKDPTTNLGSSYTFDVLEPRTFKAAFARKYTITISASPTAGGTVSGGGTFRSGKSCTLTATPNAGYTFDGWYEGSTKLSSNTSYSFTVSSNRTITGRFSTPIIILINDKERKTYSGGKLLFDDYIMRTITCSGHTVVLQVSALGRQDYATWSQEFVFTSGETAKELTRREFINHGSGEDAWYDEVNYTFLTFTLTIDGVKIVNNESYTTQNTDNLYYDQAQMDGREFTVNGKLYKLQVNRDLY